MAAESNFLLEDTAFINGGNMDDQGRCQIVKRFIYTIRDNTEANRKRAIIDLASLVPAKGSCMKEDPRYTLKSATWDCYDWKNQSVKFYIDATYRRVSDDLANAPWNLAPFGISNNAIEREIPFRLAYNKRNKRCIPVVNTAGDPLAATTTETIQQYNFSFYARDYDIENSEIYANSINKNSQRILGKKFRAGTLLLPPFTITPMVTYDDDGVTELWRYFQINMSIQFCAAGWDRVLLNVGNRARFSINKTPELVFQYSRFNQSNHQFYTEKTWTDAKTYHADNSAYRDWLETHPDYARYLPANIPYEYGENLPLNSIGYVDSDILNADIADADFSGYPERSFREFPMLSWSGLNLPAEIKVKWR